MGISEHSIARRPWRGLLLCGLGLLCSACINRTSKASYPEVWSRVTAEPKTECPALAGRYTNDGEIAPGSSFSCMGRRSKYGPYRGEWCAETALSQNIGDLASGDWVELRQPDRDTLVVISSDPTVAVREMRHNRGDFRCSVEGGSSREPCSEPQTMSSHGNNSDETSVALGAVNATSTAYAAALASGGVRTLKRRFSLAADGSLVMTVSQSEEGVLLLIPYHEHYETFVRWAPVAPPSGGAGPNASIGTAEAAATDLPSAHVGIFDATNGNLWSKVKVTNLDGLPVNTYAGYKGEPIAMGPGRHWIQVGALSPHWIPPRDVDTRYAFEMEAVAGHRYRIPTKPSACLAPGNIDAALASPLVYHTRLSIIDEVPGSRRQRFDVGALACVREVRMSPMSVCRSRRTPQHRRTAWTAYDSRAGVGASTARTREQPRS